MTHQDLTFYGPSPLTINPKQYQIFEIGLRASGLDAIKYQLDFSTLHNPYEQHKVIIQGQGFQENLVVEDLPGGLESEIKMGDAIVGMS